jgi:hypothetical protein
VPVSSPTPPLLPFAKDINAQFPPGGSSTSATFTVPAGKRLVIETAVLLINLPLGQIIESFTIPTSVNGQVIFYSLFPTLTSQSDVTSFFGINQPLKIYADGGTQVSGNILRSGSGTGGFDLVVSGYLVDM